MEFFEIFSQMVSGIVPLIGATTVFTALPFAPKIGFGRACMLGIRSKFFKPRKQSQRETDIEIILREFVNNKHLQPDQYLIVKGQKGIGKTCVIATALQRTFGVSFMGGVRPETNKDFIMSQALTSITNISFDFINRKRSAERVIWWYQLLFRRRPILVIPADEREEGQKYAELPQSARELAKYGVFVIIDASDNSLPPQETTREHIYEMQPMPDNIIVTLPQLIELFDFLKKINLCEVFLDTCGGCVSRIEKLSTRLVFKGDHDKEGIEKRKKMVEQFVIDQISNAIKDRNKCISCYPETKDIFNQFKTIQTAELVANPILDLVYKSKIDLKNVLRLVKRDNGEVYIPASRSMSLVLRSGIEKVNSFADVRDIVSLMKKSNSFKS